ncbi:MAG TPA: NADH-quinone oxidoreductase subunit NuoE [bacterium]|jgi:NADH-quinone oxidoreductase subunit E|nr:NADH-quinone oxidoreductase subunit NuoE [bacterium]
MTPPRLSDNAKSEIRSLMSQFPQSQSALLGALFVAQDEAGYLPPEVIEDVAAVLGLPVSEVASVASFYHLFFFKPVGRYVVQVCTNISCTLEGCGGVLRHLRRALGIDVGGTTADGRFTLRTAECLAACEEAPVMLVGTDRHGRLTPEKVDALLMRYHEHRTPDAEPRTP